VKRFIAALICAVALASATIASAGPTLPWTTFSGMAKDAKGVQPTACGFMAVVSAEPTTAYVLLVNEAGTRIIIWYDPNFQKPDAPPVSAGYGVVDPANNDQIPPLSWIPFDPTANPCLFLNGKNDA
jgi:hypothetical protein